jgi:hypothetical protein
MGDEKTKLERYLELRLTKHCGHREASRLAGYNHTAPIKAARAVKFIEETKPRSRSNDPKPDEMERFLLEKLQWLNAKMDSMREDMRDIRMKLQALNAIKPDES